MIKIFIVTMRNRFRYFKHNLYNSEVINLHTKPWSRTHQNIMSELLTINRSISILFVNFRFYSIAFEQNSQHLLEMVLNFCSLVVAIVTFLKDFQQQQQQNGKKCIKSKPTPTSIRYTLGCGIVMRSLKSFICMNKQCLFWSFCSFYFQIFAMKYSRYLLCGCIWKFFSDKKKSLLFVSWCCSCYTILVWSLRFA